MTDVDLHQPVSGVPGAENAIEQGRLHLHPGETEIALSGKFRLDAVQIIFFLNPGIAAELSFPPELDDLFGPLCLKR